MMKSYRSWLVPLLALFIASGLLGAEDQPVKLVPVLKINTDLDRRNRH